MYIGVIAGNHQQFMDWIFEETRFPDTLVHRAKNTFYSPSMVIRYIATPDAARGIEFNLIIMTGRYRDKWTDDQINALHLRLR